MSYWQDRARQDKLKSIKVAENGIEEMKRLLLLNLKDVQKQIETFYKKYENKFDDELPLSEFKKYKLDLKKIAEQYPQDKTLQKIYKKDIPLYNITRLRQLETDLQSRLTIATAKQDKIIYKTLSDVAKVSNQAVKQRVKEQLGVNLNTLSDKAIKGVIKTDWINGTNFSEKIWKDREVVGRKLTEVLETGLPQGKSMQKLGTELAEVTNNSFNNAYRLVRTESAYVTEQETLRGYEEAAEKTGVEYYIYDAFIDSRTSEVCKKLDGKKFKISDAVVGENYPPMHPNCRSTTRLDTSNVKLKLKFKDKAETVEPPKEETKPKPKVENIEELKKQRDAEWRKVFNKDLSKEERQQAKANYDALNKKINNAPKIKVVEEVPTTPILRQIYDEPDLKKELLSRTAIYDVVEPADVFKTPSEAVAFNQNSKIRTETRGYRLYESSIKYIGLDKLNLSQEEINNELFIFLSKNQEKLAANAKQRMAAANYSPHQEFLKRKKRQNPYKF